MLSICSTTELYSLQSLVPKDSFKKKIYCVNVCDTLYMCDVLYHMCTYRDQGQLSGQLSHFTV